MPRTSDAKQKLIRSAIRLFRQQGYHATGLTQLLEESSTPKGSFYHHFPSGKEGLAVAAVEQAGREIETMIAQAFVPGHDPAAAIHALAVNIGHWFEATHFRAGCPITAVLLDTVPASEDLRLSCDRVYARWEMLIAAHLSRHGLEKQASELAAAIVAAIEGAWVLSRAKRSTSPFLAVAATLARAVKFSR